jgi:ribose transport system substrate-binding protein
VEQARRPAPLGLRPELRRPHLVQRRAERQGDGRGAVQGDGRRGRHRGLGGILSNIPAIERKRGLDQALAENPKIKLLDVQVANWVQTEALEKTNAWLTQFGDQIKGIWAANDDMALGAIEALRADGRAGKVP